MTQSVSLISTCPLQIGGLLSPEKNFQYRIWKSSFQILTQPPHDPSCARE
ncbi:hypothetical protein OIU77_002438 [Salix suchowensis]|uniref:Uncharacterized protein n=1 Tax=Salix suchowensis TaxID=1278906 RepID=A0ABQ8ZG50_9ROSI|nr:hypothetical protein OIU77_002438 [Salix suchowensis]